MTSDYSPLILISKYRNAVMGLAIVDVMLGHWFGISQTSADNILLRLISIIPALVSTQGFLFMSGYGMYYSLSRNGDTLSFYKRRLDRMILPFVLMALPYFLFRLCFEGISVWQFLGYVTSVAYWTEGNYCGMWYVAVSVVLYLLCPVLYPLFFWRKSFVRATSVLVVLLAVAVGLNHYLYACANDYYQLFVNGIERYYMFFVGMYCGYLSREETKTRTIGLCLVVAMLPLAYLLAWYSSEYDYLTAAARRLVITMPLVSVLFALIDRTKVGVPLMKAANWLGAYTLELYILHLLIYCFLSSEVFSFGLSDRAYISIAIGVALIVCKPVQSVVKLIISMLPETTAILTGGR